MLLALAGWARQQVVGHRVAPVSVASVAPVAFVVQPAVVGFVHGGGGNVERAVPAGCVRFVVSQLRAVGVRTVAVPVRVAALNWPLESCEVRCPKPECAEAIEHRLALQAVDLCASIWLYGAKVPDIWVMCVDPTHSVVAATTVNDLSVPLDAATNVNANNFAHDVLSGPQPNS
jgi:hypothetical protein